MTFVTKRIHAFLDYPVAIALIALPFLFGLGSSNPLALQLSVATGIAAFILTLLTDHHLGVFKVISYRTHLIVDFIVAIVFIIAPFALSFEGVDAYYYWINGIAVITVVSLHKSELTV
ncbi:SPW repeat domain-containing protein [Winogradskyella sp.]|uniref:SPW repeat domain-containing protein n=1 Tax=Winogradskyella sp. TaxID=1883156 RepID=UPI003BAA8197